MKDFSCEIAKAIEEGKIEELIREFCGDISLRYEVSPEVVTITRDAFSGSDPLSVPLDVIYHTSKQTTAYENDNDAGKTLAVEVPFTAIFEPGTRTIHEFLIGETGDETICYWGKGDLLERSSQEAGRFEHGRMILGHTHPVLIPDEGEVRRYGALPSRVFYEGEKDVKTYVDDEQVLEQMLQSRVYEQYGADYCELLLRSRLNSCTSTFAMIMSAALDQLGLFQVYEDGVIMYYPWEIE